MVIFLGVSFAVFCLYGSIRIETENADKLVEEFCMDIYSPSCIFALLMFVPGLGAVWGIISASASYAFASLLHLNPIYRLHLLNIFHHVWRISMIAYYNLYAKNVVKKQSEMQYIPNSAEVCTNSHNLAKNASCAIYSISIQIHYHLAKSFRLVYLAFFSLYF